MQKLFPVFFVGMAVLVQIYYLVFVYFFCFFILGDFK